MSGHLQTVPELQKNPQWYWTVLNKFEAIIMCGSQHL